MIDSLNAKERQEWLSIFTVVIAKSYDYFQHANCKDVVDAATDVADLGVMAIRARIAEAKSPK